MSNPSTAASTRTSAPTNQWIKGIVYTALFGALFIVATLIKIPLGFTPVPISLGTFAIMLAGGLLGATYGFWSIFIVVALTATGLPFIGGAGGLAKLTGPTAGYIWMYPIAALLIGLVSDALFSKTKKLSRTQQLYLLLAIFGFGSLLLYVSGIPWLAHSLDNSKYDTLSGALKAGLYPFLPGDAIKAVVATLVIVSLKPVLPSIRPLKKK
ncbi:biotin transporter BioY [Cohnella silvisoli]|uniref:Biotin transporter n=1 Tax=Cohnella silvisoli TaxID=2873699 RepID=A0ABV1KVC6_9BACL|nr:biotin transporter BioY [Cohnella silvisoli]MCD9023450.1 biotin transporter BioY [Cohnella silvisoli]